MLAAIWAQDQNGLIGKNEVLPWYLPDDLKFFKEMTLGKTLVMGRKTFEGMGGRPLPGRRTIILTRNENYQAPVGVHVMNDIKQVIAYAKASDHTVFIAGGGAIYATLLPACDYIFRTVIEDSFEGDTYFPEVKWENWRLVKKVAGKVDEKNKFPHSFEEYERIHLD
ncbi:dihydrofolate reductase [Enterococcus canintestini]|uniref:dihydrofolate reductase n=1 Tax=Enterococcus canintestini TaxID=317010 RepID=UPI00288E2894|nr:dihydrofolate reductase [Enterococcus canintestini]MDT2738601.1 dihydrofolate reductase [Enterococcus canintestini]